MLSGEFYQRNSKTVALDLLGKILCFRKSKTRIFRGRIFEVEAYLGVDDPAAHSYKGRKTDRVRSMYLIGGHTYVYMIYGIHHCLNIVAGKEGDPQAVLIRALEPLDPLGAATNGPGRLCKAWGIDKKQDGLSLFQAGTPMWIEEDDFQVKSRDIVKTSRIGVEYAKEAALWPLRFYLKGHTHVSRK